MKLIDVEYPWLPWPVQIDGQGWRGDWRECRVGPSIRNRFWAMYLVVLFRLVGRNLGIKTNELTPRWYAWFWGKGWA